MPTLLLASFNMYFDQFVCAFNKRVVCILRWKDFAIYTWKHKNKRGSDPCHKYVIYNPWFCL